MTRILVAHPISPPPIRPRHVDLRRVISIIEYTYPTLQITYSPHQVTSQSPRPLCAASPLHYAYAISTHPLAHLSWRGYSSRPRPLFQICDSVPSHQQLLFSVAVQHRLLDGRRLCLVRIGRRDLGFRV